MLPNVPNLVLFCFLRVLLLGLNLLNLNSDLRGSNCEYVWNPARADTNKNKSKEKNQTDKIK